MSKIVFGLFLALTLLSGYLTYSGIGLQGVSSINESPSVRSHRSGVWVGGGGSSSSGYSSGK